VFILTTTPSSKFNSMDLFVFIVCIAWALEFLHRGSPNLFVIFFVVNLFYILYHLRSFLTRDPHFDGNSLSHPTVIIIDNAKCNKTILKYLFRFESAVYSIAFWYMTVYAQCFQSKLTVFRCHLNVNHALSIIWFDFLTSWGVKMHPVT